MPQPCSICSHPKRAEINKALVADGASLRAVARQYDVSKDALQRHVKNGHIEEKIKKAQAAQDVVEADDLLSEILDVQKFAQEMREKAETQRIALEANRDISKILELKGKILGSFSKDKENKQPYVIVIEKENANL